MLCIFSFFNHDLLVAFTFSACVPAYLKYYSKSASGFYESYPSTTYVGCEAFCSAKVNCKGFGYYSPTSTCHLSATDTPEPDTSSWTFSKKVCLDGMFINL